MTYYMNPHPALARSPLPSMGEGTGVRAGYRNCLYGHDITSNRHGVEINCALLTTLVETRSFEPARLGVFPAVGDWRRVSTFFFGDV